MVSSKQSGSTTHGVVAFCVNASDNVAVLLDDAAEGGTVNLRGERNGNGPVLLDSIQAGHKVALEAIPEGSEIRRYGVVIGVATNPIHEGSWVHLHNCRSLFDERSQTLDWNTGAPTDTAYE